MAMMACHTLWTNRTQRLLRAAMPERRRVDRPRGCGAPSLRAGSSKRGIGWSAERAIAQKVVRERGGPGCRAALERRIARAAVNGGNAGTEPPRVPTVVHPAKAERPTGARQDAMPRELPRGFGKTRIFVLEAPTETCRIPHGQTPARIVCISAGIGAAPDSVNQDLRQTVL